MKHLISIYAFFVFLTSITYAVEHPTCLKFGGEEKCGYGCTRSYGQIYCGDKPGMSCLTHGGQTKCGYDCKGFAGVIACGSEEGDNCVQYAGNIKCGKACRVSSGTIECGIALNAHGRRPN